MQKFCAFFVFLVVFVLARPGHAEIASSTYVDAKIQTVVSKTENETVDGVKTYSQSPIVPTPPLP